jgi:isochorismate hydrolase
MKEKYFDNDNISAVCNEMLTQTAKYRTSSFQNENLADSALLVLDMQNYFFLADSHANIPSIDAIIPNVNSLIRKFEAQKLPIIFTKHHNNNITPGSMLNFWNSVLDKSSKFFSFIESVIIPDNSIIIEKSQYDAFFDTKLDDILIQKRVENLVICGVFTHLCVETTIRSAFCHDYTVLFPIDATATYNKLFHYSSLVNLGHGYAYPFLAKDIIKLLKTVNS